MTLHLDRVELQDRALQHVTYLPVTGWFEPPDIIEWRSNYYSRRGDVYVEATIFHT